MEWIELGDLAQINNGYAFKSKEYQDKGIRIIRITNVQKGHIEDSDPKFYDEKDMKDLEKFYLFEGDILISLTGNVGRVARVTKEILPAALNQRVASIKPRQDINYDYLFHMMNSDMFENLCINESNGVAQKNLGTTALAKIKIPVPPIETQKQIVGVLNEAQTLIGNRKEQIKLLDDLIEAIFYDMFGDPVKNEKRWEVEKLGKLGDLKNGMNYSRKDLGYTVKCIGVGDFKNLLEINNIDILSEIDLNSEPREEYLLKDGDILFVRSNGNRRLVGRNIAIYPGSDFVTFSGFCIRFRITSRNIISKFLNYALHTKKLRNKLLQNIRGANIQNLNQKMLYNLEIPVPPIHLQNQFAEKVELIESQKQLLEESLKLLEDNYNNLMQRAFKGEIF
jgi:type I restriction enzyme S subunit